MVGLLPLIALTHCTRLGEPRAGAQGYILISLSGLRADALGFAGTEPSVSPFLDGLAERALVYERAVSNSPETLIAHVSLLSGLYPAEHHVVAPGRTLSADVPVLPEHFAAHGYRTAGFTAGGYVSPDYGFDRGFDQFEVAKTGTKSPFDRAVKFLRGIGEDPFFVFIHSDALQEALTEPVGGATPAAGGDSSGGADLDLLALVAGRERLTPEASARMTSRYMAGLARLDRRLAAFFRQLEALGVRERAVVALTADHGFEFGEHGLLGHVQVYPETLAVPLLFFGPGIEPERVETLAQTVDVAPSLYALAHLPMPRLAGMVLPGSAAAVTSSAPRPWAVAVARERRSQETLLLETEGSLFQLVTSRLRGEHDGTWVTRQVTFDTAEKTLDLSVVSFLEPRPLRLDVDGRSWFEFSAGTAWSELSVPLPAGDGVKRVSLRAEGCDVPREVGAGPDRRCLSFKIRGLDLSKTELFDLRADPGARADLAASRSALAARMTARLETIQWTEAPSPGATRPRAAALAAIEAHGEYPEPPHP